MSSIYFLDFGQTKVHINLLELVVVQALDIDTGPGWYRAEFKCTTKSGQVMQFADFGGAETDEGSARVVERLKTRHAQLLDHWRAAVL